MSIARAVAAEGRAGHAPAPCSASYLRRSCPLSERSGGSQTRSGQQGSRTVRQRHSRPPPGESPPAVGCEQLTQSSGLARAICQPGRNCHAGPCCGGKASRQIWRDGEAGIGQSDSWFQNGAPGKPPVAPMHILQHPQTSRHADRRSAMREAWGTAGAPIIRRWRFRQTVECSHPPVLSGLVQMRSHRRRDQRIAVQQPRGPSGSQPRRPQPIHLLQGPACQHRSPRNWQSQRRIVPLHLHACLRQHVRQLRAEELSTRVRSSEGQAS